jgi:hypothetical protein
MRRFFGRIGDSLQVASNQGHRAIAVLGRGAEPDLPVSSNSARGMSRNVPLRANSAHGLLRQRFFRRMVARAMKNLQNRPMGTCPVADLWMGNHATTFREGAERRQGSPGQGPGAAVLIRPV